MGFTWGKSDAGYSYVIVMLAINEIYILVVTVFRYKHSLCWYSINIYDSRPRMFLAAVNRLTSYIESAASHIT